MDNYRTGTFIIPQLSDGGVFYRDSQLGIYKPTPIPKDKIVAGFFGSAYGEYEPKDIEQYKDTVGKTIIIGQETAKRGIIGITGAAPGIPHQAAHGVSMVDGGIVVGISPVGNESFHVNEYMKVVTSLQGINESLVNEWDTKPIKPYNAIFYLNIAHRSPQRRFVQRDLPNLYTCRIAFFSDGDAGTNHEAAIARELGGRVIAILEGSGGISEYLEVIMKEYLRKENDTVVIADNNPDELVKRAYEAAQELHERRKGNDDTFDFMIEQAELTIEGKSFQFDNHSEQGLSVTTLDHRIN